MDRAFSLLILLVGLTGFHSKAAPVLTLSANSVVVNANTTITNTITGLGAGETVTVERFADVNNNGAIDFGEPALRTFVVQDGVRPTIGGVVNGNVPADADGVANGTIRIDLPFPGVDVILNRQPGKYTVRVSGASGSATAPFEITPPNLPQRVTGVLKNAANNATIPFGIVVILVGEGTPIGSVRTDATGAFTFIATPGDYGLVPFVDGYAASFQFVSIAANQTVTQNVLLTPAPARISGKLSDASTGAGLGSVFILAQMGDGGEISGALTDSNGNFGLNVTAGSWEIRPMPEQAAQIGYVVDEAGPTITASASAVTQNLTARKANALVAGRVTAGFDNPVANLPLRARQQSPLSVEAFGRSDANGDYFLGLLEGSWQINSDGAAVELGYREVSESVMAAPGGASIANVRLSAATAFVRGRVVNGSGAGIASITVQARHGNDQNSSSSVRTGGDGSFEIPVWAGSWTFELEEEGMITPTIRRTVVDGVDQNIIITVPNQTGQILGSVKHSSGTAIGSIFVMAQATINNVEYKSGTETDSTGNFQLPAINGSWTVSLACNDLQERSYNCPNNQNANVAGNNPVVNFTVQNFVTTASINGRVIDGSGAGVGGVQVGATTVPPGTSRGATSLPDGSFNIPVYGGQWDVQIFDTPAGFISSHVERVTVIDGVNVNNVQIKLLATDATITGTLKDTSGAPLSGIPIYSSATIDNFSYFARSVMTDASGAFTLAVSRSNWNVMVDCLQLNLRDFRCVDMQTINASSGSAIVNFVALSQSAPASPEIEMPLLNQSGQIPIFRFTLRGQPGTYDIFGSPAIPFTWTQVAATTIGFGGQTATPEFNPGTNRFFRVQMRP